jgi:hypothetical protein
MTELADIQRITHGGLAQTAGWLRLSAATAALAAAGSLASLSDVQGFYGRESAALVPQAIAQDVVNLAVVVPAFALLVVLARRGGVVGHLLLLGVLAFTVYNYAIYALAIHVGPLFLVWTAVLGGALYALVGGLRAVRTEVVQDRLNGARASGVAWFLVIVGALFALLWLKEILPASWSGGQLRSATELGLPSNPVHVLDLAFYLPAVIATGLTLRRRHPLALALAPGMLVFLLLTSLPILVTPLVSSARGEAAAWGVLPPVGVIAALATGLLFRLLARDTPDS